MGAKFHLVRIVTKDAETIRLCGAAPPTNGFYEADFRRLLARGRTTNLCKNCIKKLKKEKK